LIRFFNLFCLRVFRLNDNLGAIAIFFLRASVLIFRPKQLQEIVQQIYYIGAKSAQIVTLVGFLRAW
jgi:ABC-type transporter Mla maintaining outer membrane lipid asymmetry permease subunit MlaE